MAAATAPTGPISSDSRIVPRTTVSTTLIANSDCGFATMKFCFSPAATVPTNADRYLRDARRATQHQQHRNEHASRSGHDQLAAHRTASLTRVESSWINDAYVWRAPQLPPSDSARAGKSHSVRQRVRDPLAAQAPRPRPLRQGSWFEDIRGANISKFSGIGARSHRCAHATRHPRHRTWIDPG